MNSTAPAVSPGIQKSALSFNDAAAAYLRRVEQNLRSAATVAGVVRRFQREWGDRPLGELTHRMIEDWKDRRLLERTRVGNRPVSKSGVNHELAILRALLGWARRNDLIDVSPMDRVELFRVRNRRKRPLAEDQIVALEAVLRGRRRHLLPLVALAVNTGMRRGELLALRWQDVDLERRTIFVRESKNGEQREIPLAASLVEGLRRLRGTRPAEWPVFSHADGRPLRTVATSWAAACREAGVPGLHLHDLRHTFASRMLTGGFADVATLQDLMGHRTPAMTLRYSHAFGLGKRTAIDRMDGLNGRAA